MDLFEGGFEDVASTSMGGGIVRCEECGATDFTQQGGFFFCQVCNTQSQSTRRYERDEFSEIQSRQFTQKAATLREGKNKQNARPAKQKIVSFEAFNCCLKLMTDRLIEIGFPETLRDTVFNLWTAYLEKRKAIFVSSSNTGVDCLETLGGLSHGKNSEWAAKTKHSKKKRKVKKKKPSKPSEELDKPMSFRGMKQKKSLDLKKAMVSQYSFQLADLMEDVPESGSNTEQVERKGSLKKKPCKFTKQSKNVVRVARKKGLPLDTTLATVLLKPETFSFRSLLSLIFIALRQIGCSILMSDIIRLVWNGTLYFSSFRLVFGNAAEEINSKIDGKISNSSYSQLTNDSSETIFNMLSYLEIQDFRFPQILEFLPKFIDDFALPREMECFIIQMEKVLSVGNEKFFNSPVENNNYLVQPEAIILSVIIIVLKLLFGMDDVTERYQSAFALKVNSILEETLQNDSIDGNNSEWTKLFVIENWFPYLRRREQIYSSQLINPVRYQPLPQNPSSALINNLVNSYAGHKGKNYRKVTESDNCEAVQEQFGNYIRSHPHSEASNNQKITSLSLPREDFLRQYKSNSSFDVTNLDNNFTKTRIDFVLNPKKYVRLLNKAGHNVKVLKGNARNYPDLEQLEKNYIILFQPFKMFDDYMPKSFCYTSSLKFIVDLCSRTVFGSQHEYYYQRIETIIDHLLYFYSRHAKCGVLKVFPYDLSESDDEASDSSEHLD